jgi:hypothetical protein
MTVPPSGEGQAIAEIGDVRLAIVGGNLVSALNDLDRAWFSVEMRDDLRIEYLAPVKVEIDGHPMIEGRSSPHFRKELASKFTCNRRWP